MDFYGIAVSERDQVLLSCSIGFFKGQVVIISSLCLHWRMASILRSRETGEKERVDIPDSSNII